MMKLAFMLFGRGSIKSVSGVEKVFVDMANAMVKRGHQVYAIYNDEPDALPFWPFEEGVQVINLGLGKIKIPLVYKILRELQKVISYKGASQADLYRWTILAQLVRNQVPLDEVDILICHELNSSIVASMVSGKPIVRMLHNSVEHQLGALTPWQLEQTNGLSCIQVLTPRQVEEAKAYVSTPVVCIPNVVRGLDVPVQQDAECQEYRVVTIGRVDPLDKRPLQGIRAFAKIAHKYPQWKYYYYGPIVDQTYQDEILSFVMKAGLEGRVIYGGVLKEPILALQTAHICMFPSKNEGFGLALAEALASGIPAIGYATAEGVKDLISHEFNGLLVNTEEDLPLALNRLIQDTSFRVKLGRQAVESMSIYSSNSIYGQWEELYTRLVRTRG